MAVLVVESETVRLPPTFDVPSNSAPARVRLALPLAPLVFSDAAPVRTLAEVSVIVAFDAEVLKEEVPVIVNTPVWVKLPVLSTTVSVPPTVDAAKAVARLFVRLTLPPVAPVVTVTAPVSRLD